MATNYSWISNSDKDLHIFVPNDQDEESAQMSIEIFTQLYNLRTLRLECAREYWLLDMSYWMIEGVSDVLSDLSIDLDDDFYSYTYLNEEVQFIHLTNGQMGALFDL